MVQKKGIFFFRGERYFLILGTMGLYLDYLFFLPLPFHYQYITTYTRQQSSIESSIFLLRPAKKKTRRGEDACKVQTTKTKMRKRSPRAAKDGRVFSINREIDERSIVPSDEITTRRRKIGKSVRWEIKKIK